MSSSGPVIQAADRRGPQQRTPVTTYGIKKIVIAEDGTAHNRDLTSASFFNGEHYMDSYVSISVEGGASFWYYWSDSASDAVDKTATGNGVTVGAFIPGGIVQDEQPTNRYLCIQTSAAANVHIWISSGNQ